MELIVKKSKEIIEHLTPHAISFYVSPLQHRGYRSTKPRFE